MGYNTAAMFLNDTVHTLKDDTTLGRRIYEAIGDSQHPDNRNGVDFRGGILLPSRHADDVQVIAVGHNHMRLLGVAFHVDMQDSVEVLKRVADEYGYRLVKKAGR